jgi:hypothetical protein
MTDKISEQAKAIVRRNTEAVQGGGDWTLFDTLFADDFFDHSPPPGGTRDKAGVLELYKRLRAAFPDFRAEIHWQQVEGDVVTTFKTYHGTHQGDFLGIPATGKTVSFGNRRRHARRGRQDQRALGRRQSLLGSAAAGRDCAAAASFLLPSGQLRPAMLVTRVACALRDRCSRAASIWIPVKGEDRAYRPCRETLQFVTSPTGTCTQ